MWEEDVPPLEHITMQQINGKFLGGSWGYNPLYNTSCIYADTIIMKSVHIAVYLVNEGLVWVFPEFRSEVAVGMRSIVEGSIAGEKEGEKHRRWSITFNKRNHTIRQTQLAKVQQLKNYTLKTMP